MTNVDGAAILLGITVLMGILIVALVMVNGYNKRIMREIAEMNRDGKTKGGNGYV